MKVGTGSRRNCNGGDARRGSGRVNGWVVVSYLCTREAACRTFNSSRERKLQVDSPAIPMTDCPIPLCLAVPGAHNDVCETEGSLVTARRWEKCAWWLSVRPQKLVLECYDLYRLRLGDGLRSTIDESLSDTTVRPSDNDYNEMRVRTELAGETVRGCQASDRGDSHSTTTVHPRHVIVSDITRSG